MEPFIVKISRTVMSGDANYDGNLFGGRLLEWFDELAGIAARRFTHSDIVTAAVNDISFLHPMPLGSFLDLTAQVVHVGNTSLKVEITVMMDKDYKEDTQIQTAKATFIFVAVDKNGRPHKIEREL